MRKTLSGFWAGLVAVAAAGADFRFVQGDGYLDLFDAQTPVYRHMTPVFNPAKHGETFKVFHHVYGFHGEGFLTKGAGGLYTHHRGLFLGWSQTSTAGKTMDSWHGGAGSSQRHARYLPERELTGARARRASVAEWTMADNSVIVRDIREVTATIVEPGRLVLDFSITLESATGAAVTLDGDAAHAGFQFRADSIATGFTYLQPTDAPGTGETVSMKDSNSWMVQRFGVASHNYAVMHMDHPANPRPTVYNYRDYGRFGTFFRATVAADKPLQLLFRVLILDTDRHGALTPVQAKVNYDAFAKGQPSSIRFLSPFPKPDFRFSRGTQILDLRGRRIESTRRRGLEIGIPVFR